MDNADERLLHILHTIGDADWDELKDSIAKLKLLLHMGNEPNVLKVLAEFHADMAGEVKDEEA